MQRRTAQVRCYSWVILAAFVLFSFAPIARGDIPPGPELLDAEHALSMEFETPHTKWAKPYAQGTTRVLFFAPWYQGGTECREMIELMQRFDLDADAVYCFPPGDRLVGDGDPRWYQDPELATKRLLRLLETPYDVIFMNQIPLAKLNGTAKAAVLAALERGTGLVYVGNERTGEEAAWGADAFTPQDQARNLQAGQSPTDADRQWMPSGLAYKRLYSYGKSRIIHLFPREALTYEAGWEARFDYQMEHQGRALLWAAGKLPQGFLGIGNNPIEMLPPEMAEAARKAMRFSVASGASGEPTRTISPEGMGVRFNPDAPWVLHWGGLPPETRLTVRIRDGVSYEREIVTQEAEGTGLLPLEIPWLRSGAYYVETSAQKDGRVLTWAGAKMFVTTGREIGALDLDRDWAEIGERIEGAILVDDMRAGDAVVVRVYDGANRLLSEAPATLEAGGAARFSVEVPAWFPMLVRVEAVLANGGYEFDTAHALVRITNRKRDQFHFILWNAHSTDLAPYGAQAMARYGVTSVLQNNPLPALSAANLAFVPYAASFRASSHSLLAMLDENGVLKSGCVHDEAGMAKFVAETVARADDARKMGTFVYSLGDENAVRAGCLSDHCRVAYQNYLRDEVYGGIEALNASWGTRFASFDEVDADSAGDLPAADAPAWFREFYAQRLVKNQTDDHVTSAKQIEMGDINDEMRALQRENFARWYDRQDFQNWSYVQWCKRFVKAFKEIDPHALTGFEGTDSFSIRRLTTRSRQGGDIDLFMREMEYFGPYNDPASEVVRSLARGAFPRGNWIGYSMDPDVELGYYWGQITNGFNAVQWWRLDNVGQGYHGFLAPDLAPSPTSRALIDDTRIVRDGLGDLLMRYTMETDGVAMLYSLPSTYIAHFDGNPSYGLYVRDHERWIEALHNAGVQFDYVTDRQLRLGEFDASKYKVLILPLAFAIGDKEADVIRAFVQGGGTLIADLRPGLYNDRCKPREASVLDDLFGVKRVGKQSAVELDRMRVQGELNRAPLYMEWGNWYGKDIYPQMHTDPTVELTTGEALGWNFPIHFHHGLKYPAAVVNDHGDGRAILLNFGVYYAPMEDLLPGLLAAGGVEPAVRVRAASAESADRAVARLLDEQEQTLAAPGNEATPAPHPRGLEVTRWRDGDVELLALLDDVDRDVTVALPQPRYVYDLRAGKPLGHVREFNAAMRKARASFFALLHQEAAAPVLELEGSAVQDAPVRIAIRANGGGARAIQLALRQPDGATAAWAPGHVIADEGGGAVTLPFALNDPRGAWVLEARDLFSGLANTVRLTRP